MVTSVTKVSHVNFGANIGEQIDMSIEENSCYRALRIPIMESVS